MLLFNLIETLLGLGMLIALGVLAFHRRYWLVILGVVVTVGSFPAYRLVRQAYENGSWQMWLFRIGGVAISGAFIWIAIRATLHKRRDVLQSGE